MSYKVYNELKSLDTESVHRQTVELDLMSALEIVSAMNREDMTAASAVEKALPQIAQAAEIAAGSFNRSGRLIYVGAGTSGRLGVLDAAECPPTFGVPREQVVGIIAGGHQALVRSIEGAEDDMEAAIEEINGLKVDNKDTVCGITASRRTPFVKSALVEAVNRGAKTIFVCCNPPPEDIEADVVISVITGPEILAGSTRLKAGTATKMILNMISTTAMILTGKTYKNLMVNLMPWSEKLRARSRLALSMALDLNYEQADALLEEARGNIKAAITMNLYGIGYEEALGKLKKTGGKIRVK